MALYQFKFADCEEEIEQLHRLNYAAFVEEIPQHPPNPERRLVDQFHAQNTYAIGLAGEEVIAMLALRSQRPFSLDNKLADLDDHLPPHGSACEIRLLYIGPGHRNGKVLRGLMELVAEYAVTHGHDIALISGTTRQQKLYQHLGLEPFGPLVGQEPARFQPMYLTLGAAMLHTPWVESLPAPRTKSPKSGDSGDGGQRVRRGKATWRSVGANTIGPNHVGVHDDTRAESTTAAGMAQRVARYDPPLNYLPGPVNIPAAVFHAMQQPPISHRSEGFLADVARLQARLCALVGAQQVEFLAGSGTLANEAVAAQLMLLDAPGVVLVNGEFGRRLVDQAARWHLPHQVIDVPWGAAFDPAAIERVLVEMPAGGWLWCVHSETSTGMVNDLGALAHLCTRYDVKLCVDCISSIGAIPIALQDVFLASGTSGKALGALAGLALVFANGAVASASAHVPSYLDLARYRAANGVPFTMPTGLVYALEAALNEFGDYDNRRAVNASTTLRNELRRCGFEIVARDEIASPAVTTIVLPRGVASTDVGAQLAEHGFLTSYQSSYLVARNWLQVCLMGAFRDDALPDLVDVLQQVVQTGEGKQVASI